jgi:hypothetical protein
VRQAALEAYLPFIEPQTGDVYAADSTKIIAGTGPIITGAFNATTGNGAAFLHSDNLHLTVAGNEFLGAFMAGGIQAAESYNAYGRV